MNKKPYLSEVAQGCTMEEFMSESVVRMANGPRANAVTVVPLPEQFSSEEVSNQLYVAKKKLEELEHQRLGPALSNAAACAKISYDTARVRVMEMRQQKQALIDKYTSMLQEVLGWEPGLAGEALKKYMIKELRIAIVCDGISPSLPTEIPPEQFLAQQITKLKREVKLCQSQLTPAESIPTTTAVAAVEE